MQNGSFLIAFDDGFVCLIRLFAIGVKESHLGAGGGHRCDGTWHRLPPDNTFLEAEVPPGRRAGKELRERTINWLQYALHKREMDGCNRQKKSYTP